MFQTKVAQKIETYFMFKIMPCMR